MTSRPPLDNGWIARTLQGVMFDDSPAPVCAGPHTLDLLRAQGKHRQVKPKLAAAGHRCGALHRSRFVAPAPGRWCYVEGA